MVFFCFFVYTNTMSQRIITFKGRQLTVTMRDEADASVIGEIFTHHEYRMAESVIAAALNPVVDIGAHSGFFTLYARALNNSVPIIAVEPEKNNCVALKQHLVLNAVQNVQVVEAALAGAVGQRHLELSPDSHNHKLLKPKETSPESVSVRTLTLARLRKEYGINRIGLLKMDIEGGEYEVFDGLKDEDFTAIEALIMEYHIVGRQHYSRLETMLREHGFGVQIFPSKFDKTMGFLWATNKRI